MKRKILMVDEDPNDREIFRSILQTIDPGTDVTFSPDGADALVKVAAFKPDIIFMDCVLPGIDGIECLTRLKANRSTRHTPVIMYTWSNNLAENQLAVRLGAFEVLSKTADVKKLADRIEKVIGLAQKR